MAKRTCGLGRETCPGAVRGGECPLDEEDCFSSLGISLVPRTLGAAVTKAVTRAVEQQQQRRQ